MSETHSVVGYFGKIPARADFVRAGLQRATVQAWDRWLAEVLLGSQVALAEQWTGLWMEAPVWHFALPDGMCGPAAIVGLWMPSIDKVGRCFPLMIAAACPGAIPAQTARHGAVWLDEAEAAGRAALDDDLSPEALAGQIPPAPRMDGGADGDLPCGMIARPGAGLWWTEGGPRVPARGLVLDAMPDDATFVAMLDAGYAAS